MDLPRSDFEAYVGGHFATVPGTYTLSIGQSSKDLGLSLTVQAP